MSMNVQHQTGKFLFTPPPRRIVSLVPSITELLYDLELQEEVAGITKFCVHPKQWFQTKTRIGGTKSIHPEKIKLLSPDLIFANKEENVKEQVEALAQFCTVHITDIRTIEDAYDMITKVGELTGKEDRANMILKKIKTGFDTIQITDQLRAIYLIWQKPFMSVGGDTFISSMMEAAGFINLLKDKTRYPELTVDEITELQPDVVLLSSEPFPFQQKHIKELERLTRIRKIVLADGEIFSWYGSRMLYAPRYFAKLRESLFLSDEAAA
ncbi:MAG: helical backbone metal receptor [Chitinophagaceae bacterium]|nr:helical backbone metal receptor [Chitinophagaceae bacterium]